MRVLARVLCSDLAVRGKAYPTEFRLFKAGINETTKGEFLFDEQAAASVMRAYRAQGVDLIADLEHLSLDAESPNYDPDARAHYQLELRAGELWAVNVRWTRDGKRRLDEKTQRYTSPAFLADETGRICEVVNTALVAMPATHGVPALVAANKGACAPTRLKHTEGRTPQRSTLNRMNPDDVKAALDALESGAADKALEILKNMIATAASGGAAMSTDAASSEALTDTAELPVEEDPSTELAALRKQIETLSKGQAAELVALRAMVTSLTAERDAKDQTERVALVGTLVKLGAETPATAWEGEPAALKPRKRLQDEPIAELRDRVAVLSKRGPIVNAEPPAGEVTEIKLSKAEQDYCAKHGLTPEQFQAKKASAVKKATK